VGIENPYPHVHRLGEGGGDGGGGIQRDHAGACATAAAPVPPAEGRASGGGSSEGDRSAAGVTGGAGCATVDPRRTAAHRATAAPCVGYCNGKTRYGSSATVLVRVSRVPCRI